VNLRSEIVQKADTGTGMMQYITSISQIIWYYENCRRKI